MSTINQLLLDHIPLSNSIIGHYFQYVQRLFSQVIIKTIILPFVWLTELPLYVLIIWCAKIVINNEECGFCENIESRSNYVNARKQLTENIDMFVALTFLPKKPLLYKRAQLQMAQEYWEDKQKKGENYYTEFLKKVANKYSKRLISGNS